MRIISRVACLTAVLFAAPFVVAVPAGSALAQQMRLDPSDPTAPVAATTTASAFADYQPFREQKAAPGTSATSSKTCFQGATFCSRKG